MNPLFSHRSFASVFAIFIASVAASQAGTITWINTAGGNWSVTNNWNPKSVPGAGDDAVITASGTYGVTLDISPTVNSLTLGGSSGTQTLHTGANTLSVSSASVVNNNGAFDLEGGALEGPGTLTVSGAFNWTAGNIGAPNLASALSLATNGILTLAGQSASPYYLYAFLTNAGTMRLTNGNLTLVGSCGDGFGSLINLPGALVDLQADVSLLSYCSGTEVMTNFGTVRKSGGTNTSTLTVPFYNSGTVNAQSGTLNFGVSVVANSGSMFLGAGTNLLSGGTTTLNGSVTSSNLVLGGATLVGSNAVLSGFLTWNSGILGSASTLTLATNGVLVLAGVADNPYYSYGTLSNAGTIRLDSGNLTLVGSCGNGNASVVNLPGGLVDLQADVSLLGYCTTEVITNFGTVRKSGGANTSLINAALYNSGTVDAQTGTLDIGGGGEGGGLFKSEAGATLEFGGGAYTVDPSGVLSGAGTDLLSGGTVALDGIVTSANLVLAGAELAGSNGVISSQFTWTSGGLGNPGSVSTLTLATNGVLVLAGVTANPYYSYGILTNAGTIRLDSGNLTLVGTCGNGFGVLINLPGALVDFQADASLLGYCTTETITNFGTVRKSGGTNTSIINMPFYNYGTVDTGSGTLSLSGGVVANPGSAFVGVGTNLLSGGTVTLNGSVTTSNLVLGGATLVGSNAVISGLFTWTSGILASASTLTVATNGILVLAGVAGDPYYLYTILTNAGTIRLESGNLTLVGSCGAGNGLLINLPGALVDLQADVSLLGYCTTETITNFGTVRKSGGTGTSPINTAFDNFGTLDAQSGTISLNGAYSLAGGTVNFGISGLTNFGVLALSGSPVVLGGVVSANLNGGYQPIANNTFPVLTYTSESGAFTNATLPLADAWQTNYGASAFLLIAVNARPIIVSMTNQSVNELATLSLTASATDADRPAQTLTYSLSTAPSGMTINANTGAISWTPAQTQSPSTNAVTVTVTDNGTPPLSASTSFQVVVVEVNVAPALPAAVTQTVNETTLLTVTNTATESNIHATITGYGLLNPPAGASISAGGVLTWTPSQTQSPSTNTISTVVTNSDPLDVVHPQLISTNSFTVIVKEVNNAPTLPVIAAQTVNETALLILTNVATETNIHATITGYGLLNPPAGAAINSNGVFTWTPSQSQSPSTNTITTVVNNSDPLDTLHPQLTATNSFIVVVTEVNVAPVLPAVANKTVNDLALLTVTNTATETNIHATLAYTLLSPPAGAVISASGVITWTPSAAQGPSTNVFTTAVTNTDAFDTVHPNLSATNSFTVVVFAPTLAAIPNYTINAGQTLTFTNSAADNDATRTLTFSLTSGPASASVGASSGVFVWRPGVAFAGTTNTFTVRVTDNSTPSLSASQSFTVRINALSSVTLAAEPFSGGHFQMQVSGPVGPDYTVQASAAPAGLSWTNLQTTTPGTLPFIFTDTNTVQTVRFYRVQLGP